MPLLNESPHQMVKTRLVHILDELGESMSDKTPVTFNKTKHVIKDTKKNKDLIQAFMEMMESSTDFKSALAITLTSTKNESLPIGQMLLPDKANRGDIAEGVMAAAIAARFINKGEPITVKHIYDVLEDLPSGNPTVKERKFDSPNQNPKINDTVHFYLRLAEINMKYLLTRKHWKDMDWLFKAAADYANAKTVASWATLLYENNRHNDIYITADGVGAQQTKSPKSKVDIRVHIKNPGERETEVDINISLKAGNVSQFGQVGGSDFPNQRMLWKSMFGIDIRPLEAKYTKLLEKNDVDGALKLAYDYVTERVNNMLKGRAAEKAIASLAKGIKYHATLDQENVVLVQLSPKNVRVYQFENVHRVLAALQLESELKIGQSSGLPTIVITERKGDKRPLVSIRAKRDNKPSGHIYIKNLIEKGDLLTEILSHFE